jgi:hypothetical protein
MYVKVMSSETTLIKVSNYSHAVLNKIISLPITSDSIVQTNPIFLPS